MQLDVSVACTRGILALNETPRRGGLAAETPALVGEVGLGGTGRLPVQRRLTAKAHPIAYSRHLGAAAVSPLSTIEVAMHEAIAAVLS